MKKSKQITIFLLYALIIGMVVLLRDSVIAEIVIALIGGGLLYGVLRNETRDKEELRGAEHHISKEQYNELVKPYHLTKRELELGFMILSGFSNARIAEELFISESTVKKHASHIYEKLGVKGRKAFKQKLYGGNVDENCNGK